MNKHRRKLLSQNFLTNRKLISKLLRKTSIGKKDVVLDIGAGEGILTQELSKTAGEVFAIEIDKRLAEGLRRQFKLQENVKVSNTDFRDFYLPKNNYKVFSNIPFIYSSEIIKKLVFASNPPIDAYLIVQKESADKFISNEFNNRNSQISIQISPFFDLNIIYKFNRSDFYPQPRVNCVLLNIRKRNKPLIELEHKSLYYDFVVFTFNQTKPNIVEGLSSIMGKNEILRLLAQLRISSNSKPSELTLENWVNIFRYLLQNSANSLNLVRESFHRQLKQQSRHEKINRTRNDKNWRSFKNKSENC